MKLIRRARLSPVTIVVFGVLQTTQFCFAQTIAAANLGANQVTLQLTSSSSGTGYFTILAGSGATCGSAAQTSAGENSSGTAVIYGSLPLTANIAGNYTVRNLTASTAYTVCFTPDGITTPVSQNVTTTLATVFGPAGWATVGVPGFTPSNAGWISLAFSPDGTPYVAFQDPSNGSKLTMMEYNGSTWAAVGSPDFTPGEADNISMAVSPEGLPYVAYSDATDDGAATVMKYDGSSWVLVGSADFSPGATNDISLAFSPDGMPYAAFGDQITSYKAMVMQYNGSAWVTVGSEGFSAGEVGWISLAFSPSGTPYVAYGDQSNGYKTTAMEYNGSAWVVVGSPSFSVGEADYVTLAFSPDGTPYVAYEDYGNSQKATVMQYNGSSWVVVGSAGFSAGEADYVTLAISPNGMPYVAYTDDANGYGVTVMQYNDSSWSPVGSPDFSIGEGFIPSLAFSPDGIPYVAFQDGGNGDSTTVMFLINLPAATTASATSITFSNATLNGTADDNGTATTVSFEYGTSTSYGTTVTATAPSGGAIAAGTGSTAASVGLTGLMPNTTYHFRLDATADGLTVNGADAAFTTELVRPTVTTWPTASAIVYGQTLASSTLTGGTASVPGTFSWTTSSTPPDAGTASHPVTFTPTDTTDYNTVMGTVSVTVNQATQTITFPAIASRVYGSTPFTVTATASSGLPVTIAAQSGPATMSSNTVAITGVGTVVLVATQPGNTDYSAAAPVAESFQVTAAASLTALQASSIAVATGGSVTLTATVSSAFGTPTGAVTFSYGSTILGSVTLNAGVATLTTATLPVGADAITASYAGATNYLASTSTPVTVTVTGAAAMLPGLTITANPNTVSIPAGQTGNTTLTLTPTGGFTASVALRCQNLPANSACVFAQSPVQLPGNDQPVNVRLALQTNVQLARREAAQESLSPGLLALFLWWPGSLTGCAILGRKRKHAKKQQRWLGLFLFLVAALVVGLSGCGGGFGPYVTPLGVTTVTVIETATSGTTVTTQTVNLTLTIAE